jgi:hypothetical protein
MLQRRLASPRPRPQGRRRDGRRRSRGRGRDRRGRGNVTAVADVPHRWSAEVLVEPAPIAASAPQPAPEPEPRAGNRRGARRAGSGRDLRSARQAPQGLVAPELNTDRGRSARLDRPRRLYELVTHGGNQRFTDRENPRYTGLVRGGATWRHWMTSRKRWAESGFAPSAPSLSWRRSASIRARRRRAQDGESLIRDTEIEEILLTTTPSRSSRRRASIRNPSTSCWSAARTCTPSPRQGTMGIYTGLIRQSENPNQLRGVIAHEVGHLQAGHSDPFGRNDQGRPQADDPDHGPGRPGRPGRRARRGRGAAGQFASFFGQLGALGYSREQESAPTRRAPPCWKPPASPAAASSSSSTTSATRRSSTSRGASPISAATPCRPSGSTPCAAASSACRTMSRSTAPTTWPSTRS